LDKITSLISRIANCESWFLLPVNVSVSGLNNVKYFLFYIFKILICENELVLGA